MTTARRENTVQLDKTRIVIRERGFLEIMDLALAVIRGHAWPLLAAWLAGTVPLSLLNHALLRDALWSTELEFEAPAGYVWHLIILMAAEIPLATSLVTLYLGQAMFEEQPTMGHVLRLFWGRLGQLCWVQGVLRGGGAALAVLLFLAGAHPALIGVVEFFLVLFWLAFWVLWPYLNEVLLLERNPLRKARGGTSTLARAWSMHSYAAADLIGRWLASVIVGGLLLYSLWMSLVVLRLYVVNEIEFDAVVYAVFVPLATWTVVGYFAVVRFLSYLDLRIRSEGWEVELAMRAEGARIARQLA